MDAETSLLSQMTDPDNVRKIWDNGIKGAVFVNPINKMTYEFIIQYWLDSAMEKAPTKEVIETEFPRFVFVESEETLSWLCGHLQERYVTNEVQDNLREVAKIARNDPKGALDLMFQASWKVIQNTSPRRARSNMAENLTDRRQRYFERENFDGSVRGIPMGLDLVDNHTNGLLPGELAALVGYAKTGKSIGLGWTVKSAREAGFTPINNMSHCFVLMSQS